MRDLCRKMPAHPAFGGFFGCEISSAEAIQDLDLVIDAAKGLRFHNVAVSIDNLGADWPALMGLDCLPFAELKVDRQFVTGCANDRLKQTVCRAASIELAKGYSTRVVAEEVETRADFVTANEMGFDMVRAICSGSRWGSENPPARRWPIRCVWRSEPDSSFVFQGQAIARRPR